MVVSKTRVDSQTKEVTLTLSDNGVSLTDSSVFPEQYSESQSFDFNNGELIVNVDEKNNILGFEWLYKKTRK